jgi:hypothetical protein
MAASMIILVLAFLERPAESSISLGVIIAGIPVFYLIRRFRGSEPNHS